jgi:hypothetical protein
LSFVLKQRRKTTTNFLCLGLNILDCEIYNKDVDDEL